MLSAALALSALHGLAGGAAAALGPPKDIWDPAVQAGLYTARVISCPAPYDDLVAAWEFDGRGTWPLTFSDPSARDLRQEDGKLKLTLGAPVVPLGWGNFRPGEAARLTPISFKGDRIAGAFIEIRMRQSRPPSTWNLEFRWRGDPNDTGVWGQTEGWGPPTLKGASDPRTTDWQTITVPCHQLAEADGFGLQVSGEPGNQVEIESVRIIRHVWDLYARKVISLPPGRVFAATATVAINASLFVNGRLVREGSTCTGTARYQFAPVDLKPFLRPGKNMLALHEFLRMPHTPICWLQGAVQMVSGRTIPVATGPDWKASAKEAPGWLGADLDDSAWLPPGDRDPTGYLRDMRPFTGYCPGRLPAYCGQVILENPYQPKLFYDEARPVRFVVRLPAGLAPRRPVVAYSIWDDQTGQPMAEGTAAGGGTKQDSLVYEIVAPRLPRGVHTLLVDAGGGKEPQLTRQETFTVVGRIPMPETEGRTWDDGMRPELVEEVDCTNAGDPHPFCDAGVFRPEFASKVVRRAGLVYREAPATPGNQHSWFSYKIRFRRLGRPHWVVVEYPDDAARLMEVQVVPLKRRPLTGPYASETAWVAPGVQVGGRYPNTGKLQPLRFIVWSHELEAAIVLTSAGEGSAGPAAAKISVHEIDALPALRTRPGGRRFGLMTERASVMERTYAGSATLEPPGKNPYLTWFDEAERYARYCRFTGQNMYFMGSYQYTYDNPPPVAPDDGAEGCSLVPEGRDLFINVLGANGIETMSAVEYRTDHRDWGKGWPAPHQVAAQGADLMFQVDKDGRAQGGNYQRDNPMASPVARESMAKNLRHLVRRFAGYPSWKGLALVLAPGWEGPVYDSAEVSFDDQTLRLFEAETGVTVPAAPDDPERFRKRYDFLAAGKTADPRVRDTWFTWRSEKLAQVHDAMARMVKAARPDLEYSVIVEYPVASAYDEGRPVLEVMRDVGYDPRAYNRRQGISFGRDLWSFAPLAGGRDIGREEWVRDPEVVRLMNAAAGPRRFAFIRWGFDEWTTEPLVRAATPPGATGPDPAVWPGGYWINYGTPGHRYLAERFTRALIDSDIDTFEYGFCDSTATVGGEQEMREFVRAFVSLPAARFTPLAGNGLDRGIALREARVGADYFVYVANPGDCDCEARIVVSGKGASPVTCTVDGRTVELQPAPAGKLLTVKLPPYGLTAFRGTEPMLKPLSAVTTPLSATKPASERR